MDCDDAIITTGGNGAGNFYREKLVNKIAAVLFDSSFVTSGLRDLECGVVITIRYCCCV